MNKIPYNKVCSIEDFSNEELINIIQDVFKHEIIQFPPEYPNGIPDSKQWETAMSIRALKNFNILDRNKIVLGVGVGTEITNFYLTKFVQQVFATDLYLDAGIWTDIAPFLMLIEPSEFSPLEFEQNRLVVQHMDGRWLQYPDNTFDGIFSSGSIEHFGSLKYIANACYEMGRVLKQNGILSLSTEYKISGPPEGDGWDTSTFILSQEKIMRYIVEASGLEMVDDFDTKISKNTMLTQRNLETFLENTKGKFDWQKKVANYPNLILVHNGYVFCSVHIALRKTKQYPLVDNSWAAPDDAIKNEIARMRDQAITGYAKKAFHSTNITSLEDNDNVQQVDAPNNLQGISVTPLVNAFNEWQALRLSPDTSADQHKLIRNNKLFIFLYRTVLRIRKLGKVWEAQRYLYESYIGLTQNLIGQLAEIRNQLKDQENRNVHFNSLLSSQRNTITNQNTKLIQLNDENNNIKISIADQNAKILELSNELDKNITVIESIDQDLKSFKKTTDNVNFLIKTQAEENKSNITNLNQSIIDINARVNLISSHLRYIEYKTGFTAQNKQLQEILNIDGSQLVDFIKTIENRFPELALKEPVEIFISPLFLEEPLFSIVEYFNKRINPFQFPAIIYFFNFSTANDEIIQTSSIKQLNAGGYFITISIKKTREVNGAKFIHSGETNFHENKCYYSIYIKE